MPVLGGDAGFFGEFSACSVDSQFTRDIHDSCRKFPFSCTDGVPVLPEKKNPIFAVKGQNCNGPPVVKVLPRENCIAVSDIIVTNIPDSSDEIDPVGENIEVENFVMNLVSHSGHISFADMRFYGFADAVQALSGFAA